MNKLLQTIKVYSLILFFIIGWWGVAFKKETSENSFVLKSQTTLVYTRAPLDTAITFIDRSLLHQALAGDIQLMARLIADWDIDAQILSNKGFKNIKRLDVEDFLQSQSLGRILLNEEAVKKSTSLLQKQQAYVIDDSGNHILLNPQSHKFLPQTHAAASMLLSLVNPKQIVALPRSLRNETQLYPLALTNQIPLDIDRYNNEKLFSAQPEIAFVAHYSHPATIQALTNQGVTLYTMKNIQCLEDVSEELLQVGNIANKPLQAELLKIFIDAAICAIDNQQNVFIKHLEMTQQAIPRVLVVNFHQTFTVPTIQTLTGQILTRMQALDISLKYTQEMHQTYDWGVPIDKEKLLNLDPDYLIIATNSEEAITKEFRSDKALQKLSAVKNGHIIFVDESIHHSPSQYIVLAYHDLIKALID